MTPELDRAARAVAEVLYPQWPWSELGPKLQNTSVVVAKAVWLSALPVSDELDYYLSDYDPHNSGRDCSVGADYLIAAIAHIAGEG